MEFDENKEREKRKDEHVQLALLDDRLPPSHFDHLTFVHHSLPNIGWSDINLHVVLPDLDLKSPLYINAMTGGSEKTGKINAELAIIAKATGIAMGVGSQHAGLRNESLADTYRIVRRNNPEGTIFANVGADVLLDFALNAIEMLEANALQIHLNAPQELIMPEGERDFTGWLSQIEKIIKHVKIPVIVKEVGFGMSRNTLRLLKEIGVQYVDISGRGGTNFIGIENRRREKQEYDYLRGWGQTTPISLLEAQEYMNDMMIFASGGIRNPLDAVKCLSLGAKAIGLASPILRVLQNEGTERAIEELINWHEQMKTICTMLGARNMEELCAFPLVITGEVREWCEMRGIDIVAIANRGRL
ncbi:isopentenyl pyrophosphate isomerase [Heyndrickxia shackletonii]|uniref:Isopentenyl-diphosphate delta-isomerase n=1 Tax=Heyndrickxia shackletonii TaxID=157838 RepID=A0A0Q3WSS0_9BACI|nr:type 2 isopentenyl-diphosphate Delta-isomerase [Heyndrickxia shackletonii]KQL51267.1 isopentenyl pyrophosphate isomerase [Heyndrickxia shackletonii]NEY98460.1 type 2 isopentenyl-diphosphate Delta-isomerase [Heyndrickxia shackletonii]